MSQIGTTATPASKYRHEAMFYSGDADFLDRTEPFIRGAMENDEPSSWRSVERRSNDSEP
jgi:hypothetical protein